MSISLQSEGLMAELETFMSTCDEEAIVAIAENSPNVVDARRRLIRIQRAFYKLYRRFLMVEIYQASRPIEHVTVINDYLTLYKQNSGPSHNHPNIRAELELCEKCYAAADRLHAVMARMNYDD